MTPRNVSKLAPKKAWQLFSVQEFFSGFNWDNVADKKMLPPGVNEVSSMSKSLTVGEFFNAIPWDGEAVIAAPASLDLETPIEEDVDDFTLDDFFSSF